MSVGIERNLEIGVLLDLYGGLLTDRQREMMSMYYDDDLSLSEIAEQYGISRQGVHDAVKRGAETLTQYESVMGLADEQRRRHEQLLGYKKIALEALEECRKVSFGKNIAMKVIALLESLDEGLSEYETGESSGGSELK